MIRAVLFDNFGVLYVREPSVDGFVRNQELLEYTQQLRITYKIALLSNISVDTMARYFSATEQKSLFDAVILSGSVGMIKPHPEIFEYTCEQLGVDVSEAVMIDDIEGNCDGARAAGLRAILYQSVAQVKADLAALLEN